MKNGWQIIRRIWTLQFENYIRDIFNLFSGWIITLVTLIVWLTFRDTNIMGDPFVLASAIGIVSIRNCCFNFSRTINNLQETGFLMRIFNTKLAKPLFFTAAILFSQVTNLITILLFFGIGMLYGDQRLKVVDVNWIIFLVGYLLLVIMSNAIGFIIGLTAKNVDVTLAVSNVYYFGSIFFLGLGFPWTTLVQFRGLVIISYIFPQRYPLNIMASGWINRLDMTITDEISFGFGNYPWIPYLLSIIIIIGCIFLTSFIFNKKFEWNSKKYRRYNNLGKHIAIISSIKRATNLKQLNEVICERNEINKNILKEYNKKTKKRSRNEKRNQTEHK